MDSKKLIKLMDEAYQILEENATFQDMDDWIGRGVNNITFKSIVEKRNGFLRRVRK